MLEAAAATSTVRKTGPATIAIAPNPLKSFSQPEETFQGAMTFKRLLLSILFVTLTELFKTAISQISASRIKRHSRTIQTFAWEANSPDSAQAVLDIEKSRINC